MTILISFFEGERFRKVLVIFLFFAITISSELITIFFNNIEPMDDVYSAAANDGGNFSALITFFIVLAIKMWRRKREIAINGVLSFMHILIVVVCFSPTALIIVNGIMQGSFTRIEVIVVFSFLLLLILFYITFEITDAVYRQNQKYQFEEQRHQLMQEYYARVEAQQHEIRTMKHDLKNQLIALSGYQNEETEPHFDNQINSLIERLSVSTKYDFTAHSGMNALFGAKLQRAEREGIICEFDVKMPEDIRMDETDLAVLTGNILDNAIEACGFCTEKKYIRLQCIYHNGSLIISSENSTDGRMNDTYTRKSDKINHGLGMKSIQSVVKKYNGQMHYEFLPHHFTISLTLFEEQADRECFGS